jgi:hypothetical protein
LISSIFTTLRDGLSTAFSSENSFEFLRVHASHTFSRKSFNVLIYDDEFN